ncbi:hypothetical protein PACTADRAFT_44495, partial [Pachysolen tannophilus NRRL Y-2460]
GTCCLKYSFHEGTPAGSHQLIHGVDTYVSGTKSDKVIVIYTDIYGNKFQNTLLLADKFAAAGFYVLVPDILNGEVGNPNWTKEELYAWLPVLFQKIASTPQLLKKFLTAIKEEDKAKFIGGVGYCLGATYLVSELAENGLLDAGCVAHPSKVDQESFKPIRKPILISAAETDPSFQPELRHFAEQILAENKVTYQSTVFSGVYHGFAVKGDYSVENIRYAANKALKDHIEWFERFSS